MRLPKGRWDQRQDRIGAAAIDGPPLDPHHRYWVCSHQNDNRCCNMQSAAITKFLESLANVGAEGRRLD